MVALPAFNRPIQDDEGNIVPGATVTVRLETPGLPLVQLYSDREGTTPIGNPITADAEGWVYFHVASGEYRIIVTFGAETRTIKYEQIGPPSIQNSFGTETPITTGSYPVTNTDTFLAIRRVGPTLTEIQLPPVADRDGLPFAYVDWSTSIVSDHEIRFIPDGTNSPGETVMKNETYYSVWSNSAGLARGWVYPNEDLDGWVVT